MRWSLVQILEVRHLESSCLQGFGVENPLETMQVPIVHLLNSKTVSGEVSEGSESCCEESPLSPSTRLSPYHLAVILCDWQYSPALT